MSYARFYGSLREEGSVGDVARSVLLQAHWFSSNVDFDPKTGGALPQALSVFLRRASLPPKGDVVRDRLWHLVEHCRVAVERVLENLQEAPRREQVLLPVWSVRELDASSFAKLSGLPGRNIREKLAGRSRVQAVRRVQSVDLPENRLLKAFLNRLDELLDLRQACLGQVDGLAHRVKAWLRSEEAASIGRWENLPPNNALLSHRDYRRIWDAWRWLLTLDEDIERDFAAREERAKAMQAWLRYVGLWKAGMHAFADMPLLCEYEDFSIRPWREPVLFHAVSSRIDRSELDLEVSDPACIDISCTYPQYATRRNRGEMPYAFIWQSWSRGDAAVDIELFSADALLSSSEARTIGPYELFFCYSNHVEEAGRAARRFAEKLRRHFNSESVTWLVPDALNDFDVEAIRRSINAEFSSAEPLPRSIAAVVEKLGYASLKPGASVIVTDSVGGRATITKLTVAYDDEVLRRVPETRGFYWERHPPFVPDSAVEGGDLQRGMDMPRLDDAGEWHGQHRRNEAIPLDVGAVMQNSEVKGAEYTISILHSPVSGGARLQDLQARAGDIPLWRDYVPELSIKVWKDGLLRRFHLVKRGTTVRPLRGRRIAIDVEEDFSLPAGNESYSFPLFLGDSASASGFSAGLSSPAFPLKQDVRCRLELTFEYGADIPYNLRFIPCNNEFAPITVIWRRTQDAPVVDAGAPDYPVVDTWASLGRFLKQGSREPTDLLDWAQSRMRDMLSWIALRSTPRVKGVLSRGWSADKGGRCFTFASVDQSGEEVFIHESKLAANIRAEDLRAGAGVSFSVQPRQSGPQGIEVAGPDYAWFSAEDIEALVAKIRKSLRFPISRVWSEGRSLSDEGCPEKFSVAIRAHVEDVACMLSEGRVPAPVKSELRTLLSFMHRDAPSSFVVWITGSVGGGKVRSQFLVGNALGDVSQKWQQTLLKKVIEEGGDDAIRVLATAIWRAPGFIDGLSYHQLQAILPRLLGALTKVRPVSTKAGEDRAKITRNWSRSVSDSLELLLGLLRTRSSTDGDIRALLQPGQKIVAELALQIDRIAELVAESGVSLTSKIQLNVIKPDGDRTPDLFFALRLYLTGESGAGLIRVTSVSDATDD